jgi:AcrR family transcriptional regulator
MTRRSLRREDLLERVSACVIHHHGIRGLTLQGVAEATGVSLWALRYSFDNVDRLFRAVVASSVDNILKQLRYDRPARSGVIDTIQDYAESLAAAMQSDEYRDFLYLVIRHGGDENWLRDAYETRIVGAVTRDLERLVLASGQSHGTTILLREGAAVRFAKRIETELVLPTFLPPFRPIAAAQNDLLKSIVRELFEATYAFDWEPASAA